MRGGEIWKRGESNMCSVVRDVCKVMGNEGRRGKVVQMSNGGEEE